MRHIAKVGLTLALSALLASSASAQRQPGFGGGFGGPGFLLTNKSVQEELKISKEQAEKLQSIAGKTRELMQEKMKDAGLSIEDIREKPEEFRKVMAAVNKAVLDSANKVFTKEQAARFKQIQVQQMGPRAFADADIGKTLKLTDEQKKAVKELMDANAKALRQAREDNQGDFTKIIEATQKVNKETMGKIAAKLTDEQKKTWKEMVGKPFEIKIEFRRPGGGRQID